MGSTSCFTNAWRRFTVYQSPKYILVRDPLLSVIYRGIQIGVLLYIVLWQIWLNSGYQRRETFTGQATIKIKGNTLSDSERFFDAVDLVIPPQEEGGCFITTNYVHTPHQQICKLPGFDKKGIAPAEISEICTDVAHSSCPEGRMTANGVTTGRCMWNYRMNMSMCEIYSWCPSENDEIGRKNLLSHTGNFTVFIRIDGRYPSYPYNPVSNVKDAMEYNVNLFYVSDISAAGSLRGYPLTPSPNPPKKLDLQYFDKTIEKGQIILIAFTFDCNLDFSLTRCEPVIAFQRIDNSAFSSGFNFRYNTKYYVDGQEERDLWKIYGIKIIVTVDGIGREFDIVTLFIAVGSGIGLLGISSVICEQLLRFFIREDSIYAAKYDRHYIEETAHILRKLTRSLSMRSSKIKVKPKSSNPSPVNSETHLAPIQE